MRSRLFVAALGLFLSVCGGGVAHAVVPPGNVLVNPGAEDGAASLDGGPVSVPGWVTEGGFTVVAYGSPGTPPPPAGSGAHLFAGGPQSGVARAAQTVDLGASASEIDARRVDVDLSGLTGPRGGERIAVEFFDLGGTSLLRGGVSGTAALPGSSPSLTPTGDRIPVPPRARLARVTMTARDTDGGTGDVYFDDVSLQLVLRATPRPRAGRTVVVTPTKGKIRVFDRRGNRKTVTQPTEVAVGSSIDVTKGSATIESADDADGFEMSRGSFSQGLVAVNQDEGDATVLSLGGSGSRECRGSRQRRLASRTDDEDFVVLAGRMATMTTSGPAAWVTVDRCDQTDVKIRRGEVDIADTGSRSSSPRRIRRLLGGTGRFRTRGRNSSATVRGKGVG